MASEEVENLLKELDLECLVEIFKKNKITMQVLKVINESTISELIEEIGPRVIFIDYWKKNIKIENISDNSAKKRKQNEVTESENESDDADKLVSIDVDLKKNILLKSHDGKDLLKDYSTKGHLDDQKKKLLSHLIIRYLKDKCIKINNDLLQEMSLKIVEVFPTEVATFYYKPPIKKAESSNQKSKPSSGKLVSAWRNSSRSSKKPKKTEEVENVTVQIPEDVNESLEWLKIHMTPWEDVKKHWKNTFSYRKEQLKKSDEKTLTIILSNWPILKLPEGYTLILEDFNLYELSEVTLTEKIWDSFMDIVKKFYKISSKDLTGIQLLNDLDSPEIEIDSKVLIFLILLPHFFPPRSMMRLPGNKHYKSSIGDAKASIVSVINNAGDKTKVKEDAKIRAVNLNQSLQPYLIVIGEPLQVKEVYLIVDDIDYKLPSVLEAVDLCFKLFHVLQLEYPRESEHIWLIIQKGIYGIETKYDKIMAHTEDIINKLKVHFASEHDSIE